MMILTRLHRSPLPCSAVLLAALILTSLAVTGATVYKSVDADGTVRYSDKPPPGSGEVEEIHFPDRPSVALPDTAIMLEQMAATTERLKADRLQREAARQSPAPQTIEYPQPALGRQSSPHPWPWDFNPPPYRRDQYRPRPEKELPDFRTERDRDRAEREGTWYIPKRLPDLGSSKR